jgi:hypothetical protein
MKTKITLVAVAMAMNAFAQVPNYVPTNDLIGWYPFNGNANDEARFFANGTVYGATIINDRFGKPSSAYSFDGVDDHISLSDSVHNFRQGDFTVSAWLMKYDTLVSGSVFSKRKSEADGNMINLFSNPGYEISTGFNDFLNVSVPKYKLINTWYHVVWVREGKNIKIYQNGAVISNINTPAIHDIHNSAIAEIGARYSGSKLWNLWHGAIDDLGIWTRALNEQEVQNLYYGNVCLQRVTVTDTLLINLTITGYNPIKYANTIKIYPNPTSSQITIDSGDDFSEINGYQIKIVNTLSQVVYQQTIKTKTSTVNLSSLGGKGIYFINVYDEHGNLIDVKKIVLQ